MSLRRLHPVQPDGFAFTAENLDWAKGQIAKYPEGRQASAIIPLLWRAQEQEGWLTRPAIEGVADMLGMAYIRALEVATFYFMFQLQPVGTTAHVQVCGTTSCMICGAEDLIAVCKERISPSAHQVSADGKFSWEEVECLGACSNAPMAQIGKDYYEDLTAESFGEILDAFARGECPAPGPQNGRFASEPKGGVTSLAGRENTVLSSNASVALAQGVGDVALTRKTPASPASAPEVKAPKAVPAPVEDAPALLSAPLSGGADNLKLLKGVGPKLEKRLNELGFHHFDQIASWTPAQIAWVDARIAFEGRIERDDWVGQAKVLAVGGTTEFAGRAAKGDVPSSEG